MLTSIQALNKKLFDYAEMTSEGGVQELSELSSALWAMFHEDTSEFYIDFDLIKSDAFN